MWTLVDNEDIKVGDRVRFLGGLAGVEYIVMIRKRDVIMVREKGSAMAISYTIREEDRFECWEEPVGAWKECKPEDMVPGDKIRVVGKAGSETVFRRMDGGMVYVDPTTMFPGDLWTASMQTFERWEAITKAVKVNVSLGTVPAQAPMEWVKCDLSTLSPGSLIVRTNDPADLENTPTVLEFVKYYPDPKIVAVRDPINRHTGAYYVDGSVTYYTKRTIREPSPPAPKVIDDYPHTCYHCGSPAYVGEYGIDCKGNCEASK